MVALSKVLQDRSQLLGKDCQNLGRFVGSGLTKRKVLLSCNANKEWKVVCLNLFQLVLRKIFGAYSSTRLENVISHWQEEANKNTALDKRLQSLWAKTYPRKDRDQIFFGKVPLSKADLFCLTEKHGNEVIRQKNAAIIKQYYRPGDIILIEGHSSEEPEKKVCEINNNRLVKDLPPQYTVKGWDQKEYLQQKLFKGVKLALKEAQEANEEFKRTSATINYFDEQAINVLKAALDAVFLKTDKLKEFFCKDDEDRKKLADTRIAVLDTFELLKNERTPRKLALLNFGVADLFSHFEELQEKAKYVRDSEEDLAIIRKFFASRNQTLCQTIESNTKPGRRIFVLGGAAHFIYKPQLGSIESVKKVLERHKTVLACPRSAFNLDFKKSNRALRERTL